MVFSKFSPQTYIDEITLQFDFFLKLIGDPVQLIKSRQTISQWSVKDHLEHLNITTKTGLQKCEIAIHSADHTDKTINSHARKLFLSSKFPMNTQAPGFSHPKGVPVEKLKRQLESSLLQAQNMVSLIPAKTDVLPSRSEHPLLGYFSPLDWLLFITLHQKHHLVIIHKILYP